MWLLICNNSKLLLELILRKECSTANKEQQSELGVTRTVNKVYLFTFWSWRPHGALWSLMALQRKVQEITLCKMTHEISTAMTSSIRV